MEMFKWFMRMVVACSLLYCAYIVYSHESIPKVYTCYTIDASRGTFSEYVGGKYPSWKNKVFVKSDTTSKGMWVTATIADIEHGKVCYDTTPEMDGYTFIMYIIGLLVVVSWALLALIAFLAWLL